MKNFSTSIQRKKRGKRTEYIARLTYYDKTGKRKGVSKSAATHSKRVTMGMPAKGLVAEERWAIL